MGCADDQKIEANDLTLSLQTTFQYQPKSLMSAVISCILNPEDTTTEKSLYTTITLQYLHQ